MIGPFILPLKTVILSKTGEYVSTIMKALLLEGFFIKLTFYINSDIIRILSIKAL